MPHISSIKKRKNVGRLNRPSCLLLHLSFVIIAIGGILTLLTSIRGTLHLSPGVAATTFNDDRGNERQLPDTLTLVSFEQVMYPGMSLPSDFVSIVRCGSGEKMRISMNKIGELKHYRLYQTSYDEEGGSILTISYDPYGIATVYAGFFLFILSGIWYITEYFLHLRCRHRRGINKKTGSSVRYVRTALVMAFIIICRVDCGAVRAIPVSVADSLAYRQVLYNGEIKTFSTVATRLTYKLTGKGSVAKMKPERFVTSLIEYKQDWSAVPFLKIKSERLREALQIEGNYASIADLYDKEGNYRPQQLYKGGTGTLDREILQLDEKISLLIELWNGDLFSPSDNDNLELRGEMAVNMEVWYNRLIPQRFLFIITIIAALLVLLCRWQKDEKWSVWGIFILAVINVGGYIWHWVAEGSLPLHTTSSMLELMSLSVVIISLLMALNRYSSVLLCVALLSAGFLMLMSYLGIKDPVMTPLMPVLSTPWLCVHVSIIMLSYTLLGLTMPLSIVGICNKRESDNLYPLLYGLILCGTYLLGVGIIVGAMWANVSWGRYWGWDPKETWALLTFLVNAVPLHKRLKIWYSQSPSSDRNIMSGTVTQFYGINKVRIYLYLIFSFCFILMTYYGVNYMPSLHSYR